MNTVEGGAFIFDYYGCGSNIAGFASKLFFLRMQVVQDAGDASEVSDRTCDEHAAMYGPNNLMRGVVAQDSWGR